MSNCAHHNFHADVKVARLEDSGTPFEFLGLEPGLDLQGARVSIDGQEANIAITPKGARPNPLQRMAYNIRGFDT